MERNKEIIIELFRSNVKGKAPDVSGRNVRHDGRAGHWLEEQFGNTANCDNSADLLGYELKNETTSKTTFGDWSANDYIYGSGEYVIEFQGKTKAERMWSFCRIFGKANIEKGGRHSWSGEPCPKFGEYNSFGQKLIIEPDNNDIVAIYSYDEDQRADKSSIVPARLQKNDLILAYWYGNVMPRGKRGKCLKQKLEDKFDDKGWFTCKTKNGLYDKICFGKPVTYDEWIELVKTGIVFFDSGMYEGNPRPYSQWRANNSFWDSLIYEEYR